MFYNISCYKTAAGPRNKLVERESCNTKWCKIWINGSKIYFQTKIHTIIAGGTKWGKRGSGIRVPVVGGIQHKVCSVFDNEMITKIYYYTSPWIISIFPCLKNWKKKRNAKKLSTLFVWCLNFQFQAEQMWLWWSIWWLDNMEHVVHKIIMCLENIIFFLNGSNN